MRPKQRKNYLIKKAFQFRYAFIITFFILFTSAVSSAAVYVSIFPYLSEKLANVYPQARLVVLLRYANIKALFSTIVIVPLGIWLSLILSHRVAGPWYRLEVLLRAMTKGDLSRDIQLRKNDELQSLAVLLNEVIGNLREVANENIKYAKDIDDVICSIDNELGREPLDMMKIKLLTTRAQGVVSSLRESFKKHKLE